MIRQASIVREVGTAFAVLAIYLLTILAPLHQARASQVEFEKLGYTTTEASWVLCTPAGATGQDRDQTVAKCPATGIGKHDLVLPNLASLYLGTDFSVVVPALPAPQLTTLPRHEAPGSPRAPPELV